LSPRIEVARAVRSQVPAWIVRRLAERLRHANARLSSRGSRRGFTLRICDDTEIAALHLRHMGLAGPTDVLSFPASAPVPGADDAVLGDIALSWDAVLRQARAPQPDAWLEEATQLAIHGLAHLLGHDHGTRAEARAMLRAERRAARAAGVDTPTRPYG
jgi:probable rRNA maturation factor